MNIVVAYIQHLRNVGLPWMHIICCYVSIINLTQSCVV